MLTVRNLSTTVLKPASFQVEAGECVAVQGKSGSGKSVLLRALADLDPSTGEVRLNGDLREDMPAPLWRRRVTYVAAESGWWEDRVGDHFARPDRAVALAGALGLPAEVMDWPVARLSTGERQRLALVRALIQGPEMLLLDEPTGPLDAEATERVEALLRGELARGAGVLIVTHAPEQAVRLARRHLHVADGVVTEG
ncbi:ABC transporter ATP-binding protein [Azospirillum sp. Marseille-Q6669]